MLRLRLTGDSKGGDRPYARADHRELPCITITTSLVEPGLDAFPKGPGREGGKNHKKQEIYRNLLL
jgi:hypothetical protein